MSFYSVTLLFEIPTLLEMLVEVAGCYSAVVVFAVVFKAPWNGLSVELIVV